MRRSRVLTTHSGSLPNPPDLAAILLARERGALLYDEDVIARREPSAAE